MSLSGNILKFYLYQAFWAFWLVAAIDIVFFRQNNISITQIAVLNVIWAITSFILEVPTGILADRWSRKYMLALSGVFAATGFILFSINNHFFPFAIATIFMAARFSFSSGTANALIYDSLKTLNREHEFEKIIGRSKFYAVSATIIATIVGSYIATTDIRLTYVLSAVFSLIAVGIAFSFTEPKLHESTGETKLMAHIKEAFAYTLKHPVVRFTLLYLVSIDIVISMLDEYDQLYLIAISFPLAFFGVWIALRRGLAGLGGFFAEKFKTKYSKHFEYIGLFTVLVGTILIALGNMYIGLLSFMVIFAVWGIAEILAWGRLHNEVESHRRATVESFVVFITSLLNIPLLLSFGYISDHFGIRTGYLFSPVILLVYIAYFSFHKMKKATKLV